MSSGLTNAVDLKVDTVNGRSQIGSEVLKEVAIADSQSVQSTSPCTASSSSERFGPSWKSRLIQGIHSNSSDTETRPWHPSWAHFGPLSGLFGLLLAATSLVASLGVLVGSSGENVESWNAPPSTFLAIFTAIANLSVRYAATQGVIIAWWRRAGEGSTIAKLQSDWRAGTMLRGALAAGLRTGLLGLACIFATIVVIDGPLLQRASTVVNIPNTATVPLSISMASELPHGFSGVWAPDPKLEGDDISRSAFAFNATIPTVGGNFSNYMEANSYPNRTAIYSQYSNAAPIYGAVRGCPGGCQTKIRAPALFPLACETHHIRSDVRIQYNLSAVANYEYAPPLESEGLLVCPNLLTGVDEAINLVTGFGTLNDDCLGTFQWKVCTFVSGVGEYNVLIQNDSILTTDLTNPTFVAYANNTATDKTWSTAELAYPSTLGGVVELLQSLWAAYAAYYTVGNETNYIQGNFASVLTFQSTFHNDSEGGCFSYNDPYDTIVSSMNKLMFYYGAAAAQESPEYLAGRFDPGVSTENTVTGSVLGDISVYHTDYWFFVGAAVVELVCIALILPTYWGWWRMGRPVSFSPLEMARAFNAPLLAEYSSNSNGNDLAAAAGERGIQYGLTLDGVAGERSQLGFGDPASVVSPSEGMKFDL